MCPINNPAGQWVGGIASAKQNRTSRSQRIQRWADRPLATPSGLARAIRFEGNDAHVLVEHAGRRYWLPIDSVMNEAQAKRWLRISFWRSR